MKPGPHLSSLGRLLWAICVLVLLSTLFGACDSSEDDESNNNAANNSENPDENNTSSCTEGFLGCACIDGTACFPGSQWVCLDGVCKEPSCPAGSEGCTCYADNSCDANTEGAPMRCEDGVCVAPTCAPGAFGCECTEDQNCDEGLTCTLNGGQTLCAPDKCAVGEESCPCDTDRSCGAGLICVEETCISPNCRPGAEDCWCKTDLSCDEGFQCNEEERCEEIPCTPGSLGCGCDEGECTADNAVCRDEICQEVDCPSGTEGCACLDGPTCLVNPEGIQLFCESGTCRSPECAPGEVGCRCEGGVRCDAGGRCSEEGVCERDNCIPGQENCACTGGLCQAGLRCREDNLCVDGTGHINNRCNDDGTCERGARCTDDAICRRCTLGVEGCGCDDDDRCSPGAVCYAGTCIAEENIPPQIPDEVTCYSHCTSGAEINGEYVACGSDNLMPGCLDGRTCVDGECLYPDEERTTCQSEFDCPEWQTCIDGLCYSECNNNADCSAGKQCYMHICRVRCDTVDNICPDGEYCQTTDGQFGYCLPNQPAEGEPETEVSGKYTLSDYALTFSNTNTAQSFSITNESPTYQTFVLRKSSHVLMRADGTGENARRANDGRIECDPNEVEGCECDENNPNDCTCVGEGCFCQENSECADNAFQCRNGACRPTACTSGTCPIFWLTMGEEGEEGSSSEEIEIGIESGATATVVLSDAAEVAGVRWQGNIEVQNQEMGSQYLELLYNEVPEGQWSGEMVYLATFGQEGLTAWRTNQATRDNPILQEEVGNALIQRWGAFRLGRISWDEFEAVLNATKTGAWNYANIQEACPEERGACYPYDIGEVGVEVYSSDIETTPIPDGIVDLPFAMNLRLPDAENSPELMVGRIASEKALHYAGTPEVRIAFTQGTNGCDLEAHNSCVVFMESFEADILVGGRYLTSPSDTDCLDERPDGTFLQKREPWLVPGFLGNTTLDAITGRRYRYECRDSLLPFSSDDPNQQEAYAPNNVALAISNPIPDGRIRHRNLRLLDGAIINQSQMMIFFEETFDSFLDPQGEGFSAYGFMVLSRQPVDLDNTDENPANEIPDVYEGSQGQDRREEPTEILSPECSPDILAEALGSPNARIDSSNVARLTASLIDGVPGGIDPMILDADSDEQVHYFCEDTGLFDGGPDNTTQHGLTGTYPNNNSCGADHANNNACEDGGPESISDDCDLGTDANDCGTRENDAADERIPCPAGSRVEFFTVDRNDISQADIASLACQQDGTCQTTLNTWKNNNTILVQEEPHFRCTSSNEVYCSRNRLDLRDGKDFFAEAEGEAVFVQLPSLIDEAFRYTTRFRNRQGQGIGFAPEICVPGSDQIPYCYDPAQIEEIEGRVDCLMHIHQEWYEALGARDEATQTKLNHYLRTNFASEEENLDYLPNPIVHDGFERQLSQLLIMLGDDSFTRAFASRFDLAASNAASFEGTLFEEDGINLSGAAGFEMRSLYQAAQYYQKVLDRFYTLSPAFWEATEYGVNARNFVSAETVTRYFDRVIRASTQKARTWSEIAQRYQALNRPDLARSVVERTYTATYLESIVMSRMMLQILEEATLAENREEIERTIVDAQLRYKSAMLGMQSVHTTIKDNITIFGYDPDYIPFPALDAQDFRQSNAFEVLLLRARSRVQFAREREELAINSSREFETNQAQFQSELTQLRNNYENQLGELCGTFTLNLDDDDTSNDRVYPAIKKYAHLNEQATLLGEPCGLMSNGQIHNVLAGLEDIGFEAAAIQNHYENLLSEIAIEEERVEGQCDEILEAADFLYGECEGGGDPFEDGCVQASINKLSKDVRDAQFGIARMQQAQSAVGTYASLLKCSALNGECGTSVAAIAAYTIAIGGLEVGIGFEEKRIHKKENEIADLERFRLQWQTENECDIAKVESEARVKTMLLRFKELDLEGLRLEHRMKQTFSELERLRNQARRLEIEQAESEQLAINVQAAHNNPNIRIYKNDAIINAEIAFDYAIRELYRLTRVFEYYTSTSYAYKNDLFLARLVARGDINLENYLQRLETTFYDFEELFGHPSNRVHIISLKNDILRVPHVNEDGRPLNDAQRTNLMREELTDPARLDRNGYLALPFSTRLEDVSPLTRNHKILYVEADVYGNDTGDLIGRVYLRQKGTSVIRGINNDKQFHRFDERTGVLNTIFGGVRFFDPSIYQNYRHRDRPFVNTQWELVINQRDEAVNQDINLNALTDVRLYIYYTDLTPF